MWLGSGVAVAMARGSSSEVAWEPPCATGMALKRQKKKKKKSEDVKILIFQLKKIISDTFPDFILMFY